MKDFIEQDKTQELFAELNLYLQEFKEENKKDLIKAMFPLGNLINVHEITRDFKIENFSVFIKKLLNRLDIKLDSFLTELENENIEGVYFLCSLLYNYAKEYNFWDEQRNFNREKIDNSDHGDTFEHLEQLIDKRLKRKANNGSLQTDPKLAYYLFTWRRINHDAAKNYVNQLLNTNKGIIDYLTGSLYYSSYNGEIKAIFEKNDITDITEVEPLINKVQEIKDNESLFNQLPEKSQLAILTFLEQFSNNSQ
ncbi:MAG: hypothetical protein AB4062_13390 [Crocosphaera sp.]